MLLKILFILDFVATVFAPFVEGCITRCMSLLLKGHTLNGGATRLTEVPHALGSGAVVFA